MKRIVRLVCVICLSAIPVITVCAQEDPGSGCIEDLRGEALDLPEEEYEDMEFTSGSVVSVDKEKNKITISEYDWEKDVDVNVVYAVDSAVRVEGADSWATIAAGTYVDIDYIEEVPGKKTAKFIRISE